MRSSCCILNFCSCVYSDFQCEDKRPCQYCAENELQCIDVPRKGFRGHRLKAACTNCRYEVNCFCTSIALLFCYFFPLVLIFRRHKVQCGPERPCPPCVRRGFECIEATCTCPETGSEPASCSFCRSQRRKGTSETSDHPSGSHLSEFEGQDELPGKLISTYQPLFV